MYITGIHKGFPTMSGNSGKQGGRRDGSRRDGRKPGRDDSVQISDAARELANATDSTSDSSVAGG